MTREEQQRRYEEMRQPATGSGEAFERLERILRYLRSEDGCPWDKVQTHDSLRRHMIEETYEVVNAINEKDPDHLEEELGDFLLQGVFHGLLGEEEGWFDLTTILNRVSDKMLTRHPHVFLRENVENEAKTLDKALFKWENMKQREQSGKSSTQRMSDIPRELPALMRSEKIQQKARDVGFDWTDVRDALEKVREETAEVEESCREADPTHRLEEVGDLLFAVVNVARFLEVDPEEALTYTSDKFIRRFAFVEQSATAQGKVLKDMTLEEMDALWEAAKRNERA